MSKKLRNIIIVNDFNYTQGGASKVAIEVANLLAKEKKYNIYFFSGCSNGTSELDSDITNICYNQKENLEDKNKLLGAFRGIYNLKAKKEFKKLLNKLDNEETIIHVHGWTKVLSSSVFSIARKKKFSIVLTLHDYFYACPNGSFFNYNKNAVCGKKPMSFGCLCCKCDSRNMFFKFYRYIRQIVQNRVFKKSVKNIITISDFQENILKKYFSKNINFERINNPIDLDNNKVKVDVKNNKYYLFVGRLTRGKGADVFCQAIHNLNKKGIIVGSGEKEDELKEKYPDIEFAGWKNATEVKEYMKNAYALVFPSLWYEAAPLTPLEAMQYGVPCICSNCCAAIEHINDKTGLSFDPYKDGDLEKTILEYEKMNIDKLSDSCFKYCDNLSNDFIKKTVNFYKKVIDLNAKKQ